MNMLQIKIASSQKALCIKGVYITAKTITIIKTMGYKRDMKGNHTTG